MDPHSASAPVLQPLPGKGRWKLADWGVCGNECVWGSWDPVVLGG
jgi:hypothetical protein